MKFRDPVPQTPAPELRACVVVPARREGDTIVGCLKALAVQEGVAAGSFEVFVVVDGGDDETEEGVEEASREHPELVVHVLPAPGRGTGPARRAGMDAACGRLLRAGRPDGLIASTDADSTVAPDWLRTQLRAVAAGAEAIGGRVELDDSELESLPGRVLRWRRARAADRHRQVMASPVEDAVAEHWQFSGASIGITARAYQRVGGLEPVGALEDEALERALQRNGIAIHRLESVRVTTSGRTSGRAMRGLSRDLEVATWLERRTFDAGDFDAGGLTEIKEATVSLVLPTLDVGASLPRVLAELTPLCSLGLVDELLVVDAGSSDGTVDAAAEAGVTVVAEADLMPEFGLPRGKGDALWRSLSATSGDIVAFVDTDTLNFDASFVVGLLGPLLTDPSIELVKGSFRRPLNIGDRCIPDEGGRVTELVARPLINLYLPELAGFEQPLAGETAARRPLLESLCFPVGYGVEIALLIDTLRSRGLPAMAQADLGVRQNRHRRLRDLGPMAYAVMVAAGRRIHGRRQMDQVAPGPFMVPARAGFDVRPVPVEERPPMARARREGP